MLTGALWMLLVASDRVAGQAFWAKETPKLPMAKTWAAQKTKLPRYTPPRTPDGVPDLQGVWSGAGGDNNSFLEDHEFVDVTTPAQESFVSDPPDGKVPYTPWALARRQEMLAGLGRGWPGESKERLHASPGSYCLNVSPVFSFDGQEIVQKPGYVIMLSDDNYRVIPTDGRAAVNQNVKLWMGNSRGRWDGDTLVVEVTSLNGKGWFDSTGQFYGENTRMTERWRLVDANTMDYEVRVEDPDDLCETVDDDVPETPCRNRSRRSSWQHCGLAAATRDDRRPVREGIVGNGVLRGQQRELEGPPRARLQVV